MHLSFISTRGQAGLDAPSVTVEVHLSAGLPAFQVNFFDGSDGVGGFTGLRNRQMEGFGVDDRLVATILA